jgi:hypothetical protein
MPDKQETQIDTAHMDSETKVAQTTKPEAPALQRLLGAEGKGKKTKLVEGTEKE